MNNTHCLDCDRCLPLHTIHELHINWMRLKIEVRNPTVTFYHDSFRTVANFTWMPSSTQVTSQPHRIKPHICKLLLQLARMQSCKYSTTLGPWTKVNETKNNPNEEPRSKKYSTTLGLRNLPSVVLAWEPRTPMSWQRRIRVLTARPRSFSLLAGFEAWLLEVDSLDKKGKRAAQRVKPWGHAWRRKCIQKAALRYERHVIKYEVRYAVTEFRQPLETSLGIGHWIFRRRSVPGFLRQGRCKAAFPRRTSQPSCLTECATGAWAHVPLVPSALVAGSLDRFLFPVNWPGSAAKYIQWKPHAVRAFDWLLMRLEEACRREERGGEDSV